MMKSTIWLLVLNAGVEYLGDNVQPHIMVLMILTHSPQLKVAMRNFLSSRKTSVFFPFY